MKGTQLGQTSRVLKKKEVHPLCSRKRPLSKIVASPTYKERQKKENPSPEKKKKVESVIPKFKFLQRKKRYGDNLLVKKKKTIAALKENHPHCVQTTSVGENKQDAVGMKTPFRAEKKEYIHPLCSRQRSLSKIVASPSYKSPRRATKIITSSLYNIPLRSSSKLSQRSPAQKRRYTIMSSIKNQEDKENVCNVSEISSPSYTSTIRKSSFKDRRCTTFAEWKPDKGGVSFMREEKGQEDCAMTPWKNNEITMRERLDLWLAAKNCSKTPTPSKPVFQKSPHPNRKFKSASHLVKLTEEDSNECIDVVESPKCLASEENSSKISKELEIIIGKIENKVDREEIENDLDDMISKYTTIVKFADYWICKARLASLDDDVQRVICLLEQAHTFQAQPGDRIKEEICRYLELLESYEQNADIDSEEEKKLDEEKEKFISLYAITPGRRVHFAAAESPVDFKSSVIRFCLLESKAFKRRLNAQLKRKVMTPVRRSIRVERSDLPEFLRNDNRVVLSPGEVESGIIDGEITFVPNATIDTPLNKGWLIQDETNTSHTQVQEVELSFM